MHSYLIVGTSNKEREKKITGLIKKLKAKRVNFELEKIEDTRNLGSYVNFKVSSPTAIVLKNIDKATQEALSAFLKNLEEPQENIFFIATARSSNDILPTILSRVQTINIKAEKREKISKKAINFIKNSASYKMNVVSKIKKRQQAKDFLEEVLVASHEAVLNNPTKDSVKIAEEVQITINNIDKNANVTLALTSLVSKLS
jgi:DNA polymerase III delta prime subunit